MTSLSEGLMPAGIRPGSIHRHLAAAVAAAAIADFLFFDRPVGVSLVLAFAALSALTLLANPALWSWKRSHAAAGLLLIAGLLPGLKSPGLLSLMFALAGTSLFCLLVHDQFRGSLATRMLRMLDLVFTGPYRLIADLTVLRRACVRASKAANRVPWSAWLVPLVFGTIFLALFVSANPLIENWFLGIDLDQLAPDPLRVLIWLLVIAFAWSFIRGRMRRLATARGFSGPAAGQAVRQKTAPTPGKRPADSLFGPAAILRSLFLFNGLFAVQTMLDLTYLWGGVALPQGMNYATYAHRGAYPLIATALLAAGFVLAAMRPGSDSERMPVVRLLVYLWTGQNVLLVISSMLRLNLYVEIYSLTMLRIAALIWMMLVAFGLLLIVARIALRQSNGWLISLNAAALAATLYVCSFVNFPHLIAGFNVEHSREISGQGVALDKRYLIRLGPQAIPALDRYTAHLTADGLALPTEMPSQIRSLISVHRTQMADWRGWSFRGWRLMRYLQNRKPEPAARETPGTWSYPRNP